MADRRQVATIWACALLALGACGGNGAAGPGAAAPARGDLLRNPPELLATVPSGVAVGLLGTITRQQLGSEPAPVCDIAIYRIRYETVGARNEPTEASAALMVPVGAAQHCNGPRPILLYAHGTVAERRFNIGDLQSAGDVEGLLLAVVFATQGYVVVAPNYAGYDTSTLPYHAYLDGDQQSKDMIDGLHASRHALAVASLGTVSDDGRLFITGYSEGGYVAMATHRAMQAAGQVVTASAPMSGPYSLGAFVDAVFLGDVNANGPLSAALLVGGYQRAYGDLYTDPSEVFEPAYAAGIGNLLPTNLTRSQLFSTGLLPQSALFSIVPPSAETAQYTPATAPAALAGTFAAGFGEGNLVTNAYRLRYINDALANPDGGWPVATSAAPTNSAVLPLRRALALNDLRSWVPAAPTLLCGGDGDPTVFWLNTELLVAYWALHPPAANLVSVLDVDASGAAGDPYARQRSAFEVAKGIVAVTAVIDGATDGGAAAVAGAYHAELVPPACLSAVADFFGRY